MKAPSFDFSLPFSEITILYTGGYIELRSFPTDRTIHMEKFEFTVSFQCSCGTGLLIAAVLANTGRNTSSHTERRKFRERKESKGSFCVSWEGGEEVVTGAPSDGGNLGVT
jgi:hypothetical protein